MAKSNPKHKVVSKKHVARQERERQQSTLIRNIAIGVVAAVVLLLGYGYLNETVLQARRSVAVVNGEKITLGQFQARVKLERDSLINQYIQYLQLSQSFGMDFTSQLDSMEAQLSQPLQVGQNVLDTMIYELLYRQEAHKVDINFSADDVEKEVQIFLGYYPDGTPTPEPTTAAAVMEASTLSPEQLALVTVTSEPTLAPTATAAPTEAPTEAAAPTPVPVPTLTATAYTFDGYQQAYADTLPLYKDYGLDEASFRFLFESKLYYTAIYDMVTADIPNEGEYVWARHILVADAALADVVRQKILAGEDFSTLATELSTDPSAATNYGDLGWFSRGSMVAPFEEAVFGLENIGDVSNVIQTDFGFHVIQLLGREMRPLDDNAYRAATDAAFTEWIAAKHDESDIQTFDDIWQSNIPTTPDLQQVLAGLYGQGQ